MNRRIIAKQMMENLERNSGKCKISRSINDCFMYYKKNGFCCDDCLFYTTIRNKVAFREYTLPLSTNNKNTAV